MEKLKSKHHLRTPLFIAISISLIIVACKKETVEENLNQDLSYYTQTEMNILSDRLDLPSTPFNYSVIELPAHYTNEDIENYDNTPGHNPITDAGATLGRVLFYDRNLSVDNSISCSSCHKQREGFSDRRRFSRGLNGQRTRRNSMTIINSRFYENGMFFWDERAATLEEQALMPIQDHVEMGLELDEMEAKLRQIDYYPILFTKAFGSEEITANKVGLALSQFMRSIVSYNSKFDQGIIEAGNPEINESTPYFPNFTLQENMGLDIFIKGRNGATCQYCHGTPQMISSEARNNGLDVSYEDNGKGEITGIAEHNGVFKAPSLKNIALTAPYMHDGRFETLEEVVDHYSDGVQAHPNLHFRLSTVDDGPLGSPPMKLELTQEEKDALVAFLHTLTDESISTDVKFSNPFRRN